MISAKFNGWKSKLYWLHVVYSKWNHWTMFGICIYQRRHNNYAIRFTYRNHNCIILLFTFHFILIQIGIIVEIIEKCFLSWMYQFLYAIMADVSCICIASEWTVYTIGKQAMVSLFKSLKIYIEIDISIYVYMIMQLRGSDVSYWCISSERRATYNVGTKVSNCITPN